MKRIIFYLMAVFCCLTPLWGQIQTGEQIAVTSTDNGKVRGYVNRGIYIYKGIPYAEAARFEAPHKPKAWEGIRSSMSWGPVAPLMEPTTTVNDESEFVFNHNWGYTSEDCMRLNIWTPGINDGKKRPVLFWIHGGGYTAGSSQELPSYDGENLAKKGDVVVVSINHRLNILGFLDLSAYGEKYRYSANLSILDIRMALEWVKNNISNFGGDPGNVTIFGQSGGGAKVNTLMAMPSAKGLFHKAINQSGSFRADMLEKEVTRAISTEVLRILGISEREIDNIQKVPFAELSAAGKKALQNISDKYKKEGKVFSGFGLSWGPSVDGDLFPFQLFSKEAFELSKNVPLLIGTVKNEFMASGSAGLGNAGIDQVKEYLEKKYPGKAEAYISAVKKAYPEDSRPSDLIDFDVLFRPGAVSQANDKSALEKGAPVFMYVFTWQSPVMNGKYKAMHCMELPFVFDNIDRCQEMTGGAQEAYVLADKVSQAWINFARTGSPAHPGLPVWESYNAANGSTMLLDNNCRLVHHHDKAVFELIK